MVILNIKDEELCLLHLLLGAHGLQPVLDLLAPKVLLLGKLIPDEASVASSIKTRSLIFLHSKKFDVLEREQLTNCTHLYYLKCNILHMKPPIS